MSRSEIKNLLISYGELSAEDAENRVLSLDIARDNPEFDWDSDVFYTYATKIMPSGISLEAYDQYRIGYAECKGTDTDGDGKTDSGSKKAQVMAVINSLPLTNAQKDALYYLNNWSARTIDEAPWRRGW